MIKRFYDGDYIYTASFDFCIFWVLWNLKPKTTSNKGMREVIYHQFDICFTSNRIDI